MSYDEKSFTEDWREIESLFSGKCFQCHDELLEWRFDFYWDKIARREATEVLFEWHTLGHGWWLDDTNEDITGLYLVKKNIAWRSELLSVIPKKIGGLLIKLGDFTKPDDGRVENELQEARKGTFEDGKLEEDFKLLQELQKSLLAAMLKLRAVQPTIYKFGQHLM